MQEVKFKLLAKENKMKNKLILLDIHDFITDFDIFNFARKMQKVKLKLLVKNVQSCNKIHTILFLVRE